MDHVVGAELAWAAAREGFPTLRFNWRGVGASQGSPGAYEQDARAALSLALENTGHAPVMIASLGGSCRTALALKRDVAGVCLVSPTDIEEWGPDVWVVVAQAELPSVSRVVTERLKVIPGADRTFQKNLTLVGKAVVECLNALETLQ